MGLPGACLFPPCASTVKMSKDVGFSKRINWPNVSKGSVAAPNSHPHTKPELKYGKQASKQTTSNKQQATRKPGKIPTIFKIFVQISQTAMLQPLQPNPTAKPNQANSDSDSKQRCHLSPRLANKQSLFNCLIYLVSLQEGAKNIDENSSKRTEHLPKANWPDVRRNMSNGTTLLVV